MSGFEYRVNGGSPVDVGNVLRSILNALSPSTTYLFEVRSYDREGIRSRWVPVTGETPEAPAAPPVPTGLVVTGFTSSSISVTCDDMDVEPPAAPASFTAVAQSDTEILLEVLDVSPPAAPSSFTATAQSDTEIELVVTD